MLKGFIKKKCICEYIYKKGKFKDIVSMRVGGKIKHLIYPKDNNSLIKLIGYLNKKKKKYIVIGNGTNIVPSDRYYRGCVISLKKMKEEFIEREDEIELSANYKSSKLAIKMAEKGYDSFVFLGGIPGNIAGATVMNAGAYGSEIKDLIKRVNIIDEYGRVRTVYKNILGFGYRKSLFRFQRWTIISVVLSKGKKGAYAINQIKKKREERMNSQPLDMPNSGSVFKNTTNLKAWKMIDEVGLRGYCIGGASFSMKHSNFIINLGNATAQEIYNLVLLAQKKVYEKYKISLETEIIFFNFKNV